MEITIRKIAELADSVSDENGVQIVDIQLAGSSKKPFVRVFIDREGGVTLDDCERFSRALSTVLDVEDPIQTSYVLEVSSPGLERPLKTLNDFVRNTGKRMRIMTKININNQNLFVGTLVGVRGVSITLLVGNGNEVTIPVNEISKAKLEFDL
jgi:ribosome maturation factor RimP